MARLTFYYANKINLPAPFIEKQVGFPVAILKVFKSVLLEFPSFPVVTDMSLLYQVW